MEKLRQQIEQRLSAVTGDACFYYENLATGVCFGHAADKPVVAASVIKLAVLIEAFRQMDADAVRANEMFVIARTDKLPSCGALNYLHDGLCVTFRDLCVLMTILSDNTATNLLIKRLGIGNINDTLRMLGAEKMTLNRLLFDREASSRGIENYITAREAGLLLKRLYDGEAVSGPASEDMLSILKDQRLNGKIPFLLPHSVKIAHKTGEDDGITHDVGIVYARQPFIVCFCGEHVSPPEFERAMQDITLMLYENAEQNSLKYCIIGRKKLVIVCAVWYTGCNL